jgi:hypothetical protein
MEVVVTGHNFESILPKDHPCHVYFKLAFRYFIFEISGKPSLNTDIIFLVLTYIFDLNFLNINIKIYIPVYSSLVIYMNNTEARGRKSFSEKENLNFLSFFFLCILQSLFHHLETKTWEAS